MRNIAGVALPDRTAVLATVEQAMRRCGGRWAWQGPADAAARWARDTGPKDLDVWCDAPDAGIAELPSALRAGTVADARHPGRLRHLSFAIETTTGAAVVDVTLGDLRVGPVLLMPATEITVEQNRFTGATAVADLLVRPVLRGRWPSSRRLAQAREAWAAAEATPRRRLINRLAAQLGSSVAVQLKSTLDGGGPDRALPRRARMRLAARSLAPAHITATWAQRRSVVPAGRAAGPVGLRVRGVVVALVGTDGAGKSTVADELAQRLERFGLPTSSAYFGMARGNLPGVGLARRLLGVSDTATAGKAPTTARPGRPWVRRAAAWFYATEYGWRYLRDVAPQTARRRVVIADRWVYDLRESPWPGSAAARVAEWLIPHPQVLVLPDAPLDMIHARKPERPYPEQSAQQERYRRLLAENPARYRAVVVDTSGAHPDPVAELVAIVVEAAHR